MSMSDIKIPRPETALKSLTDLKVGDVVWVGYGLVRPFVHSPKIVKSEAIKYKDHPEYQEGSSQGELYVFDLAYPDDAPIAKGVVTMEFATDCNLTEGYSHNNNYIFRSEEDARAYVEAVEQWWKKHPKEYEQELAWYKEQRELDYDYDYAD